MSLADWTTIFPGLRVEGYKKTSLPDIDYNCIAWAAGDNTQWWEPDAKGCWYWPDGAPRKHTLAAYLAAFNEPGNVRWATRRQQAANRRTGATQ